MVGGVSVCYECIFVVVIIEGLNVFFFPLFFETTASFSYVRPVTDSAWNFVYLTMWSGMGWTFLFNQITYLRAGGGGDLYAISYQ